MQWWAGQQQDVPQPQGESSSGLRPPPSVALQPILASMPLGNVAMWIAQASNVQVSWGMPSSGGSRFDQEQNIVYINLFDNETEQANTYIRLHARSCRPPPARTVRRGTAKTPRCVRTSADAARRGTAQTPTSA